jgi:hypothetical protein
MTNPQDVVSMTGPDVIAAPANVTVYQEGKTILPDGKVGIGFSGINMMAVGQTAAKVAGDVYTTYQNGQFADKERLLQQEKTDLADKLEIFAYRNQWGKAEEEKVAHQKRVDNILGWSSDSQDGGEMAKRLNTYARSITADYSSKVAIGSMREKDNVENQHLDILGANFERVVKESKTTDERDALLDGQAKFAALELARLGIKSDSSGNPLVDAETLLGHSEVERARILKLENMRRSAVDNKALFRAKDKTAAEKSSIDTARGQLTAASSALSVAIDARKNADEIDKAESAAGRGHHPSFLEERNKGVAQNKQADNTLHAIVAKALKENGLEITDYIVDGKLDIPLATLHLASRLPGDDNSKEYIKQINDLAGKVQEFKQTHDAPIFANLAASEKAQFTQQQLVINNLAQSNEVLMKAIDAGPGSDASKLQRKIDAMARFENGIKRTFDYLIPKPPTPTSNLFGKAVSNLEDQENYFLEVSGIPGIELNALVNAQGLIDARFTKAPAYVQASFAVAFDAFNKQQEKFFGEGGVSGASKYAAAQQAKDEEVWEVLKSGAATGNVTKVTPKDAHDAGVAVVIGYGLDPSMPVQDIIPALKALRDRAPNAPKIPMGAILTAFPALMSQMAVQGDPSTEGGRLLNQTKQEFMNGLREYSDPDWAIAANGNNAANAQVEMPNEVVDSMVAILSNASGDRQTANLDIPAMGTMMLSFNPAQRRDLLSTLQNDPKYINDPVYRKWVGNLDAINIGYEGGEIAGFIKGYKSTGPTPETVAQIQDIKAAATNITNAGLDAKILSNSSVETRAANETLIKLQGSLSDFSSSISIPGMTTDTPFEWGTMTASSQRAVAETFTSELTRQAIRDQKTPSGILEDAAAKAKLYRKVNETLSKQYSTQLGEDGKYYLDAPQPLTAAQRETKIQRSFTGKANNSVNMSINQAEVLGRSMSTNTDTINQYPVAVRSQCAVIPAADQDDPRIAAVWKANPTLAAVASQVDRNRFPSFADGNPATDGADIMKAALGEGTTNADIMAAHAAIATFKFSSAISKADTLAGVAVLAASARKAFSGEGSPRYHVVFENSTSNIGVGSAQSMVLKDRDGNSVSHMQLGTVSVDSGVGDRVSYAGYSDKQVQDLMFSDNLSSDHDRDGLTGNHDVITKWFNDNPGRDSMRVNRRVVRKGHLGEGSGAIDRAHKWVYDTINPEQEFYYTRRTDENGNTKLHVSTNGTGWDYDNLKSGTVHGPTETFVSTTAKNREVVRRASLTEAEKMAEDRGIDLSQIQPRDMQGGLERWMMGETVDPTLPPDPAIIEQLRREKLTPAQRTAEDTGLPPIKEVEAFTARRARMTQAQRDAEDLGG